MTDQLNSDLRKLEEFLKAGPCRRDQLAGGIYDIYNRHGFDRYTDTPETVLIRLTDKARSQ